MLPDLHTGFSRGRSGGLVFPSLSEFSTVYCDHIVKGIGIVNKAEIDVFLELSCFFDDQTDVGNLISHSSVFSKSSLNIWKFTVHVLLKPDLEILSITLLDLIDRMPDEPWNEVRDIVQETGIKIIPVEKKCKRAKWLSGEALQIAVKRREAKSKGEKERYKHPNAEFQRIARRDKKALLSNHAKKWRKTTKWEN